MENVIGQTKLAERLMPYRWLLLFLGGLLTGLTVIFPQIGIVEWVVLTPAAFAVLSAAADPHMRLRKMYLMGLAFFETFYLVVFHWFFYMYPMEFTGMSKPMAALVVTFCWLALSTFQAVGSSLSFVLLAVAIRAPFVRKVPLTHPFLLAALWAFLEWFQANSGWSGVPWGRLVLGQTELLPVIQSVSLFGSYFVTFLLVAVNGLLAYVLLYLNARRAAVLTATSLLAGNLLLGTVLLKTASDDTGEPVRVAAIQGNVSAAKKFGNVIPDYKEIYGRLTEEAAAAGADVVVWPETAIPYDVENPRHVHYRQFAQDLARDNEITLLSSVFVRKDGDPNVLYNSVIAIKPDGSEDDTVYYKRNLVPFGEFVPWRTFLTTVLPILSNIGMLKEDLAVGDSPMVFDDLTVGKIGSAICFDSIYENNIREAVLDGAQLIAVSTNDSWFWDSAAVYMHNAQSQLRALESGRYVVRSANTGVSTIISPNGEILEELNPLVKGYVMADVYLRDGMTVYTRIDDVFVYACAVWFGTFALAMPAERLWTWVRQKRRA